jgi:hypothetical protein
MFRGYSIVDVGAKLFSSEVFGTPLVYVVDRLAEEMFVLIHFHGVQ